MHPIRPHKVTIKVVYKHFTLFQFQLIILYEHLYIVTKTKTHSNPYRQVIKFAVNQPLNLMQTEGENYVLTLDFNKINVDSLAQTTFSNEKNPLLPARHL